MPSKKTDIEKSRTIVYCDISGSMSVEKTRAMKSFMSEISNSRTRRVKFLFFNTRVHENIPEMCRITARGAGNTDYGTIAMHLMKNKCNRAVIITDADSNEKLVYGDYIEKWNDWKAKSNCKVLIARVDKSPVKHRHIQDFNATEMRLY